MDDSKLEVFLALKIEEVLVPLSNAAYTLASRERKKIRPGRAPREDLKGLVHALAGIYQSRTGLEPTRCWNVTTETETGKFRELVELVVSHVTDGNVPPLDDTIRKVIEERKFFKNAEKLFEWGMKLEEDLEALNP